MHQPLQPTKVPPPPGSNSSSRQRGTAEKQMPLPSADKTQGFEEDSDFMKQLDVAVSQAVEGRHLEDVAPLQVEECNVVELGPACPPKDTQATAPAPPAAAAALPAPPLLGVAPRLPKQLAEIRQQLRMLTANCDKLQVLTSQMNAGPGGLACAPPLESLEAEHASTMGHASRLLEAPGNGDAFEQPRQQPPRTPTGPLPPVITTPAPPVQLPAVVEQPRQALVAQLTPRQPAATQQTPSQQHGMLLQQRQQTPSQQQMQMPFKQSL